MHKHNRFATFYILKLLVDEAEIGIGVRKIFNGYSADDVAFHSRGVRYKDRVVASRRAGIDPNIGRQNRNLRVEINAFDRFRNNRQVGGGKSYFQIRRVEIGSAEID